MLPILALLLLAGTACGGGSSPIGAGSTSTAPRGSDPSTTSTSPTSTISSAPTTGEGSESPSTTSTVLDDRPVAPDFALDLGTGGTFVLSEETRPVYLVFWAEW